MLYIQWNSNDWFSLFQFQLGGIFPYYLTTNAKWSSNQSVSTLCSDFFLSIYFQFLKNVGNVPFRRYRSRCIKQWSETTHSTYWIHTNCLSPIISVHQLRLAKTQKKKCNHIVKCICIAYRIYLSIRCKGNYVKLPYKLLRSTYHIDSFATTQYIWHASMHIGYE